MKEYLKLKSQKAAPKKIVPIPSFHLFGCKLYTNLKCVLLFFSYIFIGKNYIDTSQQNIDHSHAPL